MAGRAGPPRARQPHPATGRGLLPGGSAAGQYREDGGTTRTLTNETPWQVDNQGPRSICSALMALPPRICCDSTSHRQRRRAMAQFQRWRPDWQQGEDAGLHLSWSRASMRRARSRLRPPIRLETLVTTLPRDLEVLPADFTPPLLTGIDQHSYYSLVLKITSTCFSTAPFIAHPGSLLEAYPIPVNVDPRYWRKPLCSMSPPARRSASRGATVRHLTSSMTFAGE